MAAIEQRISTGVHGNGRLLVVGREGGRDGASSEKDFGSRLQSFVGAYTFDGRNGNEYNGF